MSQYDASKQNYQEVTIMGKPALFTDFRIDRTTVPEGVYRYELRHGDEDWGEPVELSRNIVVNFYGTVLTREPFQLPIDGWIPMENDSLSFLDGECRTLSEFQEKYPTSEKDVIDFYSVNDPALHNLYFSRSEEQDKTVGCVGHLRGDFGSGKQFYTTWWPHQHNTLNTPEFKADIDRTVNWLREQPDSPLRDFAAMNRCCDRYGRTCAIKSAMFPSCGFMVKTKQYVYMLRCTPIKSDYQFYIYCYQRKPFEKAQKEQQKGDRLQVKKRTEPERYVSCLNCREDTAAEQFVETKQLWGKMGGRVCYHGYQSFKAGEVNAETAHEIGVKLASELWGDRFEVVVATHCNTGHYHNHFVINSVSLEDGRKFYNSPADYARMREVSDRLCREYAISVIENPRGRTKDYTEWQAEHDGSPTFRGTIRADIDRAILASTTERGFFQVLAKMGYQFKIRGKSGAPLKYPALKPPGAKGYFRFHKLGDNYALEQIRNRILRNIQKQDPFPKLTHHPPRRCRLRGKSQKKVTGLRALYFRYCYELHIIAKQPASEKRVSFFLREDVTKLKRLDAETRLLGKNHIETITDLTQYQKTVLAEIDSLTAQRQELRKELRRLVRKGNSADIGAAKNKISAISNRLRGLRKEVVLCDDIAQRSGQIRENTERLITRKEFNRKEKSKDELFR